MVKKKTKAILNAEALVAKEKQETLDAEKALAEAKKKQPKLNERVEFNEWYMSVYLKDANLDELHHADMHGIRGYETNTYYNEIQTVKGKYERVACLGLCPKCTVTLPSAIEAYENR